MQYQQAIPVCPTYGIRLGYREKQAEDLCIITERCAVQPYFIKCKLRFLYQFIGKRSTHGSPEHKVYMHAIIVVKPSDQMIYFLCFGQIRSS